VSIALDFLAQEAQETQAHEKRSSTRAGSKKNSSTHILIVNVQNRKK